MLPFSPSESLIIGIIIGTAFAGFVAEGVEYLQKRHAKRRIAQCAKRLSEIRKQIEKKKQIPHDELDRLCATAEKAWLWLYDRRHPNKHRDSHEVVQYIKQYRNDAGRILRLQKLINRDMGFDASIECLRLIALLKARQTDIGVVQDIDFKFNHKLDLVCRHTFNRVETLLRTNKQVLFDQLVAAGQLRKNRGLLNELLRLAGCTRTIGQDQALWREAVTKYVTDTDQPWMKDLWKNR